MGGLSVEVGITLSVQDAGGVVVTLWDHSRGVRHPVRQWSPVGRGVSASELEDIKVSVAQAITDHLILGPGVQLTLHD